MGGCYNCQRRAAKLEPTLSTKAFEHLTLSLGFCRPIQWTTPFSYLIKHGTVLHENEQNPKFLDNPKLSYHSFSLEISDSLGISDFFSSKGY
jgi:hypothetical protein